jgi:beta-lactam-binding protein with PASTA domain
MRYRTMGRGADQEPDLKLSLRDWAASETDEATVHVETGRVPDLKGLSLKAAIHRVVMAGGVPRIEGIGEGPQGAYRVLGQSPAAGSNLTFGEPVKIKLREP